MSKYAFLWDKSFLTNLIAVLISVLGLALHDSHITPIGYYALSGAITNWLAIYMLFEKIPFLYGSGVVPNRFEEFKEGIRVLIMDQFFTVDNINRFFSKSHLQEQLDFTPLMEKIDFERVYQNLLEAILSSSLGSMLNMFGGPQALEPMKEPVIKKLKQTLTEMTEQDDFKELIIGQLGVNSATGVKEKVESIVGQRLDELTPQMVKVIVQNMIQKHLGWLVVWGGVLGGLIGLVVSFI